MITFQVSLWNLDFFYYAVPNILLLQPLMGYQPHIGRIVFYFYTFLDQNISLAHLYKKTFYTPFSEFEKLLNHLKNQD